MKNQRFEVVYRDGSQLSEAGSRQILVDRETGVHYLLWKSGYSGSITPLLDANGKPVTSEKQENEF